jgi:hypothetical protein
VIVLTTILAYAIPDIPASVKDKFARERLLEREALVGHDDIDNVAHPKEGILETPLGSGINR